MIERKSAAEIETMARASSPTRSRFLGKPSARA
jgi:hypothetical protein